MASLKMDLSFNLDGEELRAAIGLLRSHAASLAAQQQQRVAERPPEPIAALPPRPFLQLVGRDAAVAGEPLLGACLLGAPTALGGRHALFARSASRLSMWSAGDGGVRFVSSVAGRLTAFDALVAFGVCATIAPADSQSALLSFFKPAAADIDPAGTARLPFPGATHLVGLDHWAASRTLVAIGGGTDILAMDIVQPQTSSLVRALSSLCGLSNAQHTTLLRSLFLSLSSLMSYCGGH